jgi:fructokinase
VARKTVIGIGEVLWDVLPDGKKVGGAPANFAYHASQFGCDGIAVSAIGNDALGDEIVERFNEKHVHYELQRNQYPTGTVQVTLDAAGIPQYEICENVAWDNIAFTPELAAIAAKTDCVCFGSLAQRSAVSYDTISHFLDSMPATAIKVFDINLRQSFYTPEVLEASMRRCNILKINDDELEVLTEMFGLTGSVEDRSRALMAKYNLQSLILTCGAVGSYVFTADEVSYQATPKVQVVDTVGAGDSFTGSFCGSLLAGVPVRQAHQRAVNVAAYVCTQAGAMPTLPDELKA